MLCLDDGRRPSASSPDVRRRRRRRGPRLRRRRPRLAPARRARAASPARRPGAPADRPVGHGRQSRRAARLAAGHRRRPAAGRSSRRRTPPLGGRRRSSTTSGSLERRHGDRRAAPRREAAGVRRQPRAGRGARRRAARARTSTRFVSHSSLSRDERRRAEQAFAEARDCVIVATSSTLELGIDVGDLDRVIQIDAPATVASFLQRLGRTGRRPGTTRNCLFLTLDEDEPARRRAASMWARGLRRAGASRRRAAAHRRPAAPRAGAAGEHRSDCKTWPEWWHGLGADGRPTARR